MSVVSAETGGPAWTSMPSVGRASIEVTASDGAPFGLEVRCASGKASLTVRHGALDAVPLEVTDWLHSGSRRRALFFGYGLDLNRPDHQGMRVRFRACAGEEQGCLEFDGEPSWHLKWLAQGWTLHVLVPADPPVDARVPLMGSRRAIESVCGPVG